MATLLSLLYLAYIGLGLPHSLFGAAWPAISADLGVAVDGANYISILISGATVVSSMFGAKLAKRFGTGIVIATCATVAALALLGFSFSHSVLLMCVFAIPLGFSAGATDSSLNHFAALHFSARHMNFLHCFYGIGVLTSPYILAAMLKKSSWQAGYLIVFGLQAIVAVILLSSIPLWKKKEAPISQEAEKRKNSVPLAVLIKKPQLWLNWIMCISANAIEGVVGIWGSMYLALSRGFDEASAAAGITCFYAGIALGRFLSGVISSRFEEKKLLAFGTAVMLFGIGVMFLPGTAAALCALFLVGLGNGPVHPNILHLTPACFDAESADSVMGTQMAAAYFGIMAAPPVFGWLVTLVSATLFPVFLALWLVLFLVSALFFFRNIHR